MALLDRLRRAVRDERMEPLALAMADWGLRHGASAPVALGLALTTHAMSQGHACLPIDPHGPALPEEDAFCSARDFTDALATSALVGGPGADRPLIRDGDRLYLQRYWAYEVRLAERLRQLLNHPPAAIDPRPLLPGGDLFDDRSTADGEIPWQAVAAGVALRHRFAVIAGGPGTGKTYTVLRLIALLITAAKTAGAAPPVIRLAAPTGKAAARMMDAIHAGLDGFAAGAAVAAHLPDHAATLHRLLGIDAGTVLPRYHRDNPLAADVVIVDEASMIDLALMAKLLDALPDHARLVLLGDRQQLASVESGSVLAEICAAAGVNAFSTEQRTALAPLLDTVPAAAGSAVADHVVTLQTSRRFTASSPIGRLARAVNAGDAAAALAIVPAAADELHIDLQQKTDLARLADELAAAYGPLATAATPEAALAALEHVRLLTATRIGPTGAVAMNERIARRLAERLGLATQQRWYHGRPVIVVRNDYQAGLFNGDTGICCNDEAGHLRVWFRTEAGLRSLLPAAVPAHETAYAMTIHKSQGSEFDAVWLLLPDVDHPILSRELIYTGITRARRHLTVLGPESVLRAAMARVVRRHSGLADRLLAPHS